MSCRWGCEGWGGWGEGPGTLAPRGAGRMRMRWGLPSVGSGWQSAEWGGGGGGRAPGGGGEVVGGGGGELGGGALVRPPPGGASTCRL